MFVIAVSAPALAQLVDREFSPWAGHPNHSTLPRDRRWLTRARGRPGRVYVAYVSGGLYAFCKPLCIHVKQQMARGDGRKTLDVYVVCVLSEPFIHDTQEGGGVMWSPMPRDVVQKMRIQRIQASRLAGRRPAGQRRALSPSPSCLCPVAGCANAAHQAWRLGGGVPGLSLGAIKLLTAPHGRPRETAAPRVRHMPPELHVR